jgi:hypothetical protein
MSGQRDTLAVVAAAAHAYPTIKRTAGSLTPPWLVVVNT